MKGGYNPYHISVESPETIIKVGFNYELKTLVVVEEIERFCVLLVNRKFKVFKDY